MGADDEYESIAELPDDGSREKETYARFGLAAYYAQVFETGLANLIVVATSHAKRGVETWTLQDIDSLFEDLYSNTAGKLVARLKVFIADPELLDLLTHAVKERNRLMHRFFRDHDLDAMTADGMERMVNDADATRRTFITADRAATSILHDLLRELGIGEEHIRREFDALLARARVGDAKRREP